MTDPWVELVKPFKPEQIGKLPKPYKSDSPKGNCQECGKYHGLPAMHVDYVGHAVLTSRLLAVDPEWTWEPMGTDEHGLPAIDRAGNLWIRLTILGRTRIGVGDGKNAKEAIGDALRNAAMRFGVALDLWAKEELEQPEGNGRGAVEVIQGPPPIVVAKGRAWRASRQVDPNLSEEQRIAWLEAELRGLDSTIADADAATWNALADNLANRTAESAA